MWVLRFHIKWFESCKIPATARAFVIEQKLCTEGNKIQRRKKGPDEQAAEFSEVTVCVIFDLYHSPRVGPPDHLLSCGICHFLSGSDNRVWHSCLRLSGSENDGISLRSTRGCGENDKCTRTSASRPTLSSCKLKLAIMDFSSAGESSSTAQEKTRILLSRIVFRTVSLKSSSSCGVSISALAMTGIKLVRVASCCMVIRSSCLMLHGFFFVGAGIR